tara:strand:- start:84 stop:188 length:105 start_codon:yes stop_codon:yes gene_type:complete
MRALKINVITQRKENAKLKQCFTFAKNISPEMLH